MACENRDVHNHGNKLALNYYCEIFLVWTQKNLSPSKKL